MPTGKTAIVTGSTSGIGLGIARALAAAGYDIMLNGFGVPSEIEQERAQIAKTFGVRAAFNAADMTKPAEIAGMVEAATHELGRVDIVVNNAGIQHTAPIEQFPTERWDAVIAINLSSSFHAIRAAIPQMRERNWGRIINIASAHGLVASVDKAAYVAAKHGVIGLTRVVALETATTGITCNAICPAGPHAAGAKANRGAGLARKRFPSIRPRPSCCRKNSRRMNSRPRSRSAP